MKKITIIITILTSFILNAQYSNYYTVDVNQNINANVNQNVNVSGNISVNKNISTIDYGKLALANSQKEKNKLEQLKYIDNKEKRILLEIATDPSKAFYYGYNNTFTTKGKDAKKYGFKKFTLTFRLPHKSMFLNAGSGRLENVSSDGITTEIILNAPSYNKKI